MERSVGNFWLVIQLNGTTEHRLSHVAFDVSDGLYAVTGRRGDAAVFAAARTLRDAIR